MVQEKIQKEFHKMDTWEEWLKCWEENNFQQIAISLLHIGPEVIGRRTRGVDELVKGIRFYLKIAQWQWQDISEGSSVDYLDDQLRKDAIRKIREKAHNVLVHRFLREEPRLWQHLDKDLVMEVIDFVADPRNAVLHTEPYKSDMENLVTDLWLAGKGEDQSKFSSWKKILSERKKGLIRALVNNQLFDQILKDNVLEAIPFLKEEIFRAIDTERAFLIVDYPDFPVTKLLKKLPLDRMDRKAWMAALEDSKSQEFEVALNFNFIEKEAKTLLMLIARR